MISGIGLAVTHDTARVVAVKRGRVVWAGEAALSAETDPRGAIARLLRRAPGRRWPRRDVRAVVGPHASQVKCVSGLPPITDSEAISRIVRENVGTFFLKNGVPLVTTRVRLLEAGTVLAAALDRPWLATIQDACRSAGLRLAGVAPTALGLAGSLQGSRVEWTDGVLTLELERSNGSPMAIRCRPGGTLGVLSQPVEGLATLGDQAVRYADAYGALTIDRRDPLVLAPGEYGDSGFLRARRSLLLPGALTLASVVALTLSPLAAALIGARARRHVVEIPAQRRDAASLTHSELQRVTGTLREIGAFAESPTPASRTLAGVARVLATGTVVRSFSLDSISGQLELLTQDPTSALAAVKRLPDLNSVAFLGPMSRQTWAGRDVQRVVITFRLTRRGGGR